MILVCFLSIFVFSCALVPVKPSTSELIQKGKEAYLAGDYWQAINYFEEALQSEADPYIKFLLANSYFAIEHIDKAISLYEQADYETRDNVLKAQLLHKLALAYCTKGDAEKALMYIQRLETMPEDVLSRAFKKDEFLYDTGVVYLRNALWERGRKLLNELASLYPQSPLAKTACMKIGFSFFSVQFGVFENRELAENFRQQLSHRYQYETFIQEASCNNKKMFLVLYQKFPRWKDAVDTARKIKKLNIDVIPVP